MRVQEWLIERQQLLERIKELEAENTELRKRLGEDVTPIEKKLTAMQNLSLQEKVDLFRSLKSFPLNFWTVVVIRCKL